MKLIIVILILLPLLTSNTELRSEAVRALLEAPIEKRYQDIGDRELETVFSFDSRRIWGTGRWGDEKYNTILIGSMALENGTDKDLIKEYLESRGTYKEKPDGINYRKGQVCSEYYISKESGRVSFILYVRNNFTGYGSMSAGYIRCTTVSFDGLIKQGSVVSYHDKEKDIVYEQSYDKNGFPLQTISYQYNENYPFPFIKGYKEFKEYPPELVNRGQSFWFYEDKTRWDENGKWIGYKGDVFLGDLNMVHENECVYDSEGRLEVIKEELLKEDQEDEYYTSDSSGIIALYYKEDGSFDSINYGYSIDSHERTGPQSGSIVYDDKGRPISLHYLSGDIFYTYEGDSKKPFSRITFGWTPQSSDDDCSYGHRTNTYLFQPYVTQ